MWSIALFMLVVFIVGMPYWLYKDKAEKKRKLEEEQERQRKFAEWKALPR